MPNIPRITIHLAYSALCAAQANALEVETPHSFATCGGNITQSIGLTRCEGYASNRNTNFFGKGSADPARGQLRVVSSSSVPFGEYGLYSSVYSAGFSDSIRFAESTVFNGLINLHITGTFHGDIPYNSEAIILASLQLPQIGAARASISFVAGAMRETENGAFNWGGGRTVVTWLDPARVSIDVSVPFRWSAAAERIPIKAELITWPALDRPGAFEIDFGHTAQLSINTPEDRQFTSASGLLLTSPIPEPSIARLILLGAMCLAAVKKGVGISETSALRRRRSGPGQPRFAA